MHIAAQTVARMAIEQRASSLAGWGNAALLALVAAMFAAKSDAQIASAISAAAFVAAGLWNCFVVLRPATCGMPGYPPEHAGVWTLESELEVREAMAAGYATAIVMNACLIDTKADHLRFASISMAAAVPAALLIWVAGAVSW